MEGTIVLLFLYLLLNTSILCSGNFRPVYAVVFCLFVADFCLLGWAGTTPVDDYFRFLAFLFLLAVLLLFFWWGLFVRRVVGIFFNCPGSPELSGKISQPGT